MSVCIGLTSFRIHEQCTASPLALGFSSVFETQFWIFSNACFDCSAGSLNLSGLIVNSLKVCMEGKKVILLLSIAVTELQKLLIIKLHAKSSVQSQEQVDALA